MANIVQFKLTGKQNQFDMYYYSGTTGANAQTAIKAEKDSEGNINLDLTGKISPTATSGNTAQLWIVIRATQGSELEFANSLIEPDFGGRYWEIRSNSQVPGGTELRISSVLRWADGSDNPTKRYVSTVGSTGPTPSKPDAYINLRFEGDANQFTASYSGAYASGNVAMAANVDLSINLKDLVEYEGSSNRELSFKVAPKSGYRVTKVESVPVGDMNAYLGKIAWTWNEASGTWTTPVVNTMASSTQYRMVVTSELIPVPAKNIHIQFAGNKDHFDVVYTGGLTGSDLKPVPTTGEFVMDLVGKVSEFNGGGNSYLDFRIVPRQGCTVVSATASPTPPTNPNTGSRDWRWAKGSLPWLSSTITMATANDTLFTMTVVSTGPTPDVESPFNKLFALSRSKMEDLSNKMLGVWGDKGSETSPAASGFLLNLLLMPFKIPTEVQGDAQTIKIGSYSTGVGAPIITDDSIDVDLGTIVVADLFGSSLDYTSAQYELVLPFFGASVELAPSQVVGRSITARYNLDAYTGTATVNVFNDTSGVPIASAVDKVARSIPFKTFSEVVNKLDEPLQTNNGLMRAFIRVTRQEVVLGEYDSLVQVNGRLGETLGYMEVENVELSGVPDSERVKALLRTGVVIK